MLSLASEDVSSAAFLSKTIPSSSTGFSENIGAVLATVFSENPVAELAEQKLSRLKDSGTPMIEKMQKIVNVFYDELLSYAGNELRSLFCNFTAVGSISEGLALGESADVDVIAELQEPFIAANFEASRDISGFFTLKWMSQNPKPSFCDDEGYLDATKLRNFVFDKWRNIFVHSEVRYDERTSGMKLQLKPSGLHINIDLVPQIPFHSWGQCPDLRPRNDMPLAVQRSIENLCRRGSSCMHFTLAAPWVKDHQNANRLCNVSFSIIEREFFRNHPHLQNIVILVKVLVSRYDWKGRHKFRSYLIKRLVLKHCDELLRMNLWDGFRAVLNYLAQDVHTSGTVDGFFVYKQLTTDWIKPEARKFEMEIRQVLEMDAAEVLRLNSRYDLQVSGKTPTLSYPEQLAESKICADKNFLKSLFEELRNSDGFLIEKSINTNANESDMLRLQNTCVTGEVSAYSKQVLGSLVPYVKQAVIKICKKLLSEEMIMNLCRIIHPYLSRYTGPIYHKQEVMNSIDEGDSDPAMCWQPVSEVTNSAPCNSPSNVPGGSSWTSSSQTLHSTPSNSPSSVPSSLASTNSSAKDSEVCILIFVVIIVIFLLVTKAFKRTYSMEYPTDWEGDTIMRPVYVLLT